MIHRLPPENRQKQRKILKSECDRSELYEIPRAQDLFLDLA